MLNFLSISLGPISVLMGVFLTLYIKSKAREEAETEFAKQIKSALAVFKMDLMNSLDVVYTRKSECSLMMESHLDRLDMDTKRMDSMDARFDTIKNTLKRSSKEN